MEGWPPFLKALLNPDAPREASSGKAYGQTHNNSPCVRVCGVQRYHDVCSPHQMASQTHASVLQGVMWQYLSSCLPADNGSLSIALSCMSSSKRATMPAR